MEPTAECTRAVLGTDYLVQTNPNLDTEWIETLEGLLVSGEVKPPANPLVIPQLCLRFGDIDNVGLTGHYVLFSMLKPIIEGGIAYEPRPGKVRYLG